ncbi:capsid protein [Penicillium brasilianum partitivirus 1]|nr:capsid protein [Penicillium brasilianum partitivirus 1]
MPGESAPATPNVVDSATSVSADVTSKGKPNKGKSSGGKKRGGNSAPNIAKEKVDPTSSKSQAHGFSEGSNVLTSYGLSVSGRKERILSAFKTDKFFHFVHQSWQQLIEIKPSITYRMTYPEFKHCAALQLYSRLEQVKFDALGIKPPAPTRIPLPRNLRVFQPLWSVLSNIGIVDDDELRVTYIPDGILPLTQDLSDPKDIENLLSCTLYDWSSSWNDVLEVRKKKPSFNMRNGLEEDDQSDNEYPDTTKLIKQISDLRKKIASAPSSPPKVKEGEQPPPTKSELQAQLEELMSKAKKKKAKMIRPKFDVTYENKQYTVADEPITTNPGAYGAWMHWDPQLWLNYEQFVEEVSGIAMFSMSMPVETQGTYAWVLPVESTRDDASGVFCKLPKASVPPATWILALLLQSSTLPHTRRSTFYTETDRLNNVFGLRARYIRAAIKKPSPVEQYGTY